jgi:hypothetical protein
MRALQVVGGVRRTPGRRRGCGMGESLIIVNFDRKQWLSPLRMTEADSHARVEISDRTPWIIDLATPVGLEMLLLSDGSLTEPAGSWAGSRVAIVGDWYEADGLRGEDLFEECYGGEYRDVSDSLLPIASEIIADGGLVYPHSARLLNHDRNESFKPVRTAGRTGDMRLHELLLLAGSDRWGEPTPGCTGRWARDRIELRLGGGTGSEEDIAPILERADAF